MQFTKLAIVHAKLKLSHCLSIFTQIKKGRKIGHYSISIEKKGLSSEIHKFKNSALKFSVRNYFQRFKSWIEIVLLNLNMK
jgi:hypothetical protein